MKISGFRLETYVQRMDRGIGDVNYPSGENLMDSSILWIYTDEGISGIAPMGNDAIKDLFPLIEGQDPRGTRGLSKILIDSVFKKGNEGKINDAISAIDIALWDLKAKIADEPLWKTLGSTEGKVKVYASDIGYNLSDEELHAFYTRMADLGVEGGKIKIGLSMDDDLRRIGIMRDALSKNKERPYIMIDTNEYWSPKQAIRYIGQIEKTFDIFWAEEPARRWDYRGLHNVSTSISAAVASGENLNNISDFYPLIVNQAIDIVNISDSHSGVTGCMQVANFAYAYELPVSMMNCQANFMAHVAASLPNHSMMEVVDPGREKAFAKWDNYIDDGWIIIGQEPGLGIEVDEEKLSKLQANPPNRKSKTPFARREGAGLEIKKLSSDEVKWR